LTGRALQLVGDEGPLARVTGRLRGHRRTDHTEADLDDQIAAAGQPTRFNVAAVLSPHGGTGKTTLALLSATTLARHAQVRTVVVDASPDYGTLAAAGAVDRQATGTIGDLLAAAPGLLNPAELRPYVTQLPGGAHLLCGGPDDQPLTPDRVADLLGYLAAFYELALLDCATGIAGQLAQHAITRADHTVLVTTPQQARSSSALAALATIQSDDPTVVLNRAQHGPSARAQFTDEDDLAGAVVAIPEDPELGADVDTLGLDPDVLAPSTRVAVKDLAVRLAGALR